MMGAPVLPREDLLHGMPPNLGPTEIRPASCAAPSEKSGRVSPCVKGVIAMSVSQDSWAWLSPGVEGPSSCAETPSIFLRRVRR